MKLLLLTLILVGLPSAFAEKLQTAAETKYFKSINKVAPFKVDYAWLTPEEEKQADQDIAKSQREPSSIAADESHMSEEFRKFRDEFLKIKAAADLNQFLVNADTHFDQFKENDTRFFAAQVAALRPLRGVIWKVIPVFNKSNQKMVHSFLVTIVRSIASQMKLLLPTDQWDAGFAYITQPYIEDRDQKSMGTLAARFNDESELMGYFAGPVYDSLMQAGQRIAAIKLKGKSMVWDNQLLYGKASFVDGLDRYRLVGELEKLNTLSAIHATLASIAYDRAYSCEGLVSLYGKVGNLYGIDAFIKTVDGIPSTKRVAVLKSAEFDHYGRILFDGHDWMKKALKHIQDSVRLSSDSWEKIKTSKRKPNEVYLFDTSFAETSQRTNDLRQENAKAVVAARAELRSSITGETVVFDLPNFFNFPPADLKSFLPNHFEDGTPMIQVSLTETSGKKVDTEYRNYFVGRADGWDWNVYKLIFPELKGPEDAKKIKDYVRILNQTWGTSILALPLVNVIE